jgi:hypothetical protein
VAFPAESEKMVEECWLLEKNDAGEFSKDF